MKFQYILLCALCLISDQFIVKVLSIKITQNSSFLIVGSSIPSVITGWILSHYKINVTMSFNTENMDNYIATTKTIVYGETFELPKMQPVIFENSKESQTLVNKLNKDLHSENGFYLQFGSKSQLSIYGSESVNGFLDKFVEIGCLKNNERSQLAPFILSLEHYDYSSYRLKYSNITFAEFATLMKTPKSFMDCVINMFILNTGMTMDNFNAADALARISFYYFTSKDSLRSYYLQVEKILKPSVKGILDQMYDDMKKNNVKFIANHTTNGFYVDPINGKILGDLSDKTKFYDYVILGDSLTSTKSILQNTHDDNTGAPKIFKPLEYVLNILNKYSSNTDVASIKIWLSLSRIFKPHIIEVTDSPFPYSIQSIKLLTGLTITSHMNVILEVIVIGTNGSKIMDWNKVDKELMIYFEEYKSASIKKRQIDWIDMGVIMDVNYGTNRLTTSSIQEAGISNIILAGDWLDPINSTAVDFERAVVIAKQVLRNMTFDIK